MRTRSVLAFLAGSLVVHAALSCASRVERGGGPAAFADAMADAVLDALGGDAKPAEAGPSDPKPMVTEIACEPDAVVSQFTAKLALPGRALDDIGRTSVLMCRELPWSDGYSCRSAFWFDAKDGEIRAYCGTDGEGWRARFIVPPTP